MNVVPTSMEEEETNPQSAATPMTRLQEGRWPLLVAASFFFFLMVAYKVPGLVVLGGIAIMALVTAFIPRKASSRRLKLKSQRKIRRMWPGTGMKLTLDALPEPCFIADGRGITRYVNTAATELYKAITPGSPLSFSLRAPSLLEAFDRVTASGEAERINWVERVPTETSYEAHIAPIYMPGASAVERRPVRPDFILVVVQDLTENRRLERMRTDFVANASHELRTPLASLTGFIETLQGPAKDDEQARDRFLSIMLDQSARMRRLIDDILSLSRIELKAHVKPTTRIDLTEVVRHTVDALSPLAKDMEMEIQCDLPEVPVDIAGDRDELIQVTENLIENALKYGSTGKVIDVRLKRTAFGEANGEWQLSIQDYGVGIPAEHLPRLTERFYRVDVESSRAMKGTGLGLAIVKHILTRHRYRLDVNSELGKGATFTIVIPE